MWIPNPDQVRDEFQKIIDEQAKVIKFFEENAELSFKEFLDKKESVNLPVISIWGKVNRLTILDKKYSKIYEDMRKLLIVMLTDDSLEAKHLGKTRWGGVNLQNWELEYKKGKYRKDLIKFYKKIQAKMIKIIKKFS
jgi:hypothetical protein